MHANRLQTDLLNPFFGARKASINRKGPPPLRAQQQDHEPDLAAQRVSGIDAANRCTGNSSHGYSRRAMLAAGALTGSAACLLASANNQATASSLPPIFDRAWEGLGGGPADLFFPRSFLGRWTVASTLVKLETPLGTEQLTPALARAVERSRSELGQRIVYDARWVVNQDDKVIIDRKFNLVRLLNVYMGSSKSTKVSPEDVEWDSTNPNNLSVQLSGGISANTRVTRRSSKLVSDDKYETSEFFQQTIFSGASQQPRVKASQCFTKYKFRSDAAATSDDGVGIVATQVVSDYLTSFDGEEAYLRARNKAVVVYTYIMAFERQASSV